MNNVDRFGVVMCSWVDVVPIPGLVAGFVGLVHPQLTPVRPKTILLINWNRQVYRHDDTKLDCRSETRATGKDGVMVLYWAYGGAKSTPRQAGATH